MIKIKIKQVPDDEPNADGQWVEREVDDLFFGAPGEDSAPIWNRLTKLCEPEHHAVSMQKI